MKKGAALVGGVGLGAALMYFFDPDRGKRRRALVRDKFEAAGNKASCYAGKMGRDIRNRAYGMASETKSLFRHEDVTDEVLVDRREDHRLQITHGALSRPSSGRDRRRCASRCGTSPSVISAADPR